MLFEYSQKFLCAVFLCLAFYTLLTFYIYSTKGDMDNIIKDIKKLEKIKDKDEIISKLFLIIVEDKTSVKWPIILCISVLISSLITYCTASNNNLDQKFLIITVIIFLTIYGIFNFFRAHGGTRQLVNSIILHNNKG
jgi:hypothetical protein